MSNDKLLPCPFCGGPVELELANTQHTAMYGKREFWGVICRNTENLGGTCAIEQIPSASKEAAIERWNRRTPPAASGQQEPMLSDDEIDNVVGGVIGLLEENAALKAAAHPAPAQQESDMAFGFFNTKYGTFFRADQLAASDRTTEMLASGEIIRLYTRAPAPAALTDDLWSLINAYADAREEYSRSTERHLAKPQRENVDYAKAELERALAAASAAPAEQARQWLPIESAPKDGSEVLLFLGEPWSKIEKARWYEPWKNWQAGTIPDDPAREEYFGIGSALPTHWMPLPPAPDAAIASQQKGGV